jgi:CHAD domain-containing protein
MQNENEAPQSRIGICLHAYVLARFDIAGRSLGRSGEQLHHAIHDVRKAIRKIRATLDLGRKQLWPDAAPVFRELRQLCRTLSQVRDVRAAIETLELLFIQSTDDEIRTLLRHNLKSLMEKQALELRRLLKQDPGLKRFRIRLRKLRDVVSSLNWGEIDAESVRASLARSERRSKRARSDAKDESNGVMRHRWRRRLRRQRHQMMILESQLSWRFIYASKQANPVEASTSEWSAVVRRTAAELEQKTEILGHEHDLRILRSTIRSARNIKVSDRDRLLQFLEIKIADAVDLSIRESLARKKGFAK